MTYAVADRVSEWLEKAMIMVERRRKDLFGIRLVVQVEKDKVDQFIQTAKRAGIKYIGAVNSMVFVDVKELADIDKLAKMPGVVYISYEKKFYPMALGIDELVKRIIVATDPIFSKLSFGDLIKLGFRFRPPNKLPTPFQALVQNINLLIKAWSNPLNLTEQIRWNFPFGLPVIARAPFMIVTQTRSLMDAPDDYEIKNTLVGVIDTGTRYGPAIGNPMNVKVVPLTTLPEPPIDLMGHGSWVTSCAFGRRAMTRYGEFVPVAQAPMVYHAKVFNVFGSTTEFQVMKAMGYLAKKGAKVVNMSLGSTLTDPVDKDPTSKLLSELTKEYGTIFVVASGNEGPDSWTIASPGASPDAITVGAMDWATMDVPSYSSRGPQGMYYKDTQDVFEDHLQRYGDNFLKPDVVGIGGDEESQVVAGCSPWYDGMYDYLPDGFDEMIGSSMATPHVAGLIALLYDRGIIKTAEDVKRVLAKFSSTKSKELGYGLFKYSMFMYPTGGEAVGEQGGGVY